MKHLKIENMKSENLLLHGWAIALILALGFVLPDSGQARYGYGGGYDYYNYYDYNNDGYWSEGEWVDYSYDVIDHDYDGYISHNEWSDYASTWYEPYDSGYEHDFSRYDADNDGFWDQAEYQEAYDADLYGLWDADDDDRITVDEWRSAYLEYEAFDGGLYNWR